MVHVKTPFLIGLEGWFYGKIGLDWFPPISNIYSNFELVGFRDGKSDPGPVSIAPIRG